MVVSRAVLAFALLSACSFRANPGRGGDAGSGSGDGPAIDAPADARVDTAPGAAKMKTVTITANKIAGAVSAFPMWFVLDDLNLSAHATMSGTDIYFTKTDGTALPFERAKWTKSTGHLEAWILVDLDPAQTNAIELRYGNPNVATTPNPAMVFSNSFASVWHFEDSLANTTVVDTRGAANGTASGLATNQQVNGQLGGGFSFNGTTSVVSIANPLSGGMSSTISAWVKLKNSGFQGVASLITLGNGATNQARFIHTKYNTNLAYGFFNDDVTGGPDVSDNKFHLVHWVYDSNTNQATIYKDAAAGGARTPGGTVATAGATGLIGNSPPPFTPGGNTSNAINGIIDEVRIASAPRTQAWITTEFNNQNAPAMFYSVGLEMQAN